MSTRRSLSFSIRFLFRCVFVIMLGGTLAAQGEPKAEAESTSKPVVRGPRFEFAVYYLAKPTRDPVEHALTLAKKHPTLRAVGRVPSGTIEAPALFVHQPEMKNYAPLTESMLRYKNRGMNDAQKRAFLASPAVVVLTFFGTRADALKQLDLGGRLVHALATETGGIVWDEQTREVFTPPYWKKRRIEGWQESLPHVSRHITIHAYQDDDGMRAVTLGMARFGQADLVLTGWPRSFWGQVGGSMNAVAQHVVESGAAFSGGPLALALDKIKHAAARKRQLSDLAEGAKRAATLKLRSSPREDGDPDNLLLTFDVSDWPGADFAARLARFLEALYGAEQDDVVQGKHDEAIKAASRRARAKLPAKRKLFLAGLPPGERFLVKGPFKTKEGKNEWMWVEVSKWPKGHIVGVLMNEPHDVPDLKLGATVTVQVADVFDYIHHKADGSTEGNETGKIIAKRQKR